jgi:stage II sporulation protein D
VPALRFRRTLSFRRRLALAAVVAVAVTILVPGASVPAQAADRFTFYGSGYGHGVGMSQWGAYGLAQMGWSHSRILRHFYQGTRVDRADLPSKIRVGITEDRSIVHLTAKGGPVRLWTGAPRKGKLVATIPRGATWTVGPKGGAYAIRRESGKLAGKTTWGGVKRNLYATYAATGSRVFIPEADGIWFDGFVYNRGHIEFNLYGCRSGCAERLIVPLSLQEYLYGLGEVPTSWPMQSLEAQVVAARSYAVYSMRHYGRRSSCNCHLTDGSGDQTYIAYDREGGPGGGRWVSAVKATARQVLRYGGHVIQSFYAASDGGHSEDVEDVWHGGNPAYAIPYLRGVCDPGESTNANPWTDWQRSFSGSEVASRLSPYTGSIGRVVDFRHIVRGESGRIVTATAVGRNGSATVSGTEVRAGLGLYDDRVWINSDRNVVGAIRETYDASMCAPGLPTSRRQAVKGGAQQFFVQGGIFRNVGPDVTLWVRGAIYDEYKTLRAGSGRLGLPVARVRSLAATATALDSAKVAACNGCKRLDLAKGRIYLRPSLGGAHALWGRVLSKYLDRNGTSGALGWPITRVKTRRFGGTRASFQHGTIDCPSGKPCRVDLT